MIENVIGFLCMREMRNEELNLLCAAKIHFSRGVLKKKFTFNFRIRSRNWVKFLAFAQSILRIAFIWAILMMFSHRLKLTVKNQSFFKPLVLNVFFFHLFRYKIFFTLCIRRDAWRTNDCVLCGHFLWMISKLFRQIDWCGNYPLGTYVIEYATSELNLH